MNQSSPARPSPRQDHMQISTEFDLELGLRTHRVTGVVNLADFQVQLRDIYRSEAFNCDLNALWDLRQADFSRVLPEDVRKLMHTVVSHWGAGGQCRCAILVSSLSEYSVARTYESQFGRAAPCRIKVFLDIREALPWFVAKDAPAGASAHPVQSA